MNTHRPDDEHLPGEDELAALYRKLPRREPGPALDAAVLRAAARAVEGTAPTAAKRRARWPVALGSAAVLVLAAGLGWRMRDMPASAPPATPATVTVQEKTIPAAMPAAAQQSANEPTPADATATAAAAPPTPRMAQRAFAPKLQKPAAAMSKEASAERQAAAQGFVASNDAADMAPVAAPPPSPQGRTQQARAPAAPAPQRMVAATPMMAPAPAPASPPATGTARNPADTPDQELDKVRRLFAEHRRDEARQRLADFHRDHPDYPLPDDLREQLLTP